MNNNSIKKVMQSLLSMKAAIVLLLILSFVASLGTIVPQGDIAGFYLGHYGHFIGRIILLIGLDDLYHSPFFIILGLLITLSVLFCTIRRLKAGIKNHQRIGSLILHFSFVVIVISALISGFTAASEDLMLFPGQQRILKEGSLAKSKVEVQNFEIDYYDNGMASQYRCDLTYMTPKGEKKQQEVSVNHPLRKNFVTIYQERYGWAVRGTVTFKGETVPFELQEGQSFDLGGGKTLSGIFIPNYDEHSQSLSSLTAEPRNPALALGLEDHLHLVDMQLVKPKNKVKLGDVTVSFDEYLPYTGLRVKYDPGIPVVFFGFILALIGLILRYIPKRKKKDEEAL